MEEQDGDLISDVLVLELSLVRGESLSVPGPAVTSLPVSDRGQASNSQTSLPFRGFQGARHSTGAAPFFSVLETWRRRAISGKDKAEF